MSKKNNNIEWIADEKVTTRVDRRGLPVCVVHPSGATVHIPDRAVHHLSAHPEMTGDLITEAILRARLGQGIINLEPDADEGNHAVGGANDKKTVDDNKEAAASATGGDGAVSAAAAAATGPAAATSSDTGSHATDGGNADERNVAAVNREGDSKPVDGNENNESNNGGGGGGGGDDSDSDSGSDSDDDDDDGAYVDAIERHKVLKLPVPGPGATPEELRRYAKYEIDLQARAARRAERRAKRRARDNYGRVKSRVVERNEAEMRARPDSEAANRGHWRDVGRKMAVVVDLGRRLATRGLVTARTAMPSEPCTFAYRRGRKRASRVVVPPGMMVYPSEEAMKAATSAAAAAEGKKPEAKGAEGKQQSVEGEGEGEGEAAKDGGDAAMTDTTVAADALSSSAAPPAGAEFLDPNSKQAGESRVTLVCYRDTVTHYYLYTAFVGAVAPLEPTEDVWGTSLSFWARHALRYDEPVMGPPFVSTWEDVLISKTLHRPMKKTKNKKRRQPKRRAANAEAAKNAEGGNAEEGNTEGGGGESAGPARKKNKAAVNTKMTRHPMVKAGKYRPYMDLVCEKSVFDADYKLDDDDDDDNDDNDDNDDDDDVDDKDDNNDGQDNKEDSKAKEAPAVAMEETADVAADTADAKDTTATDSATNADASASTTAPTGTTPMATTATVQGSKGRRVPVVQPVDPPQEPSRVTLLLTCTPKLEDKALQDANRIFGRDLHRWATRGKHHRGQVVIELSDAVTYGPDLVTRVRSLRCVEKVQVVLTRVPLPVGGRIEDGWFAGFVQACDEDMWRDAAYLAECLAHLNDGAVACPRYPGGKGKFAIPEELIFNVSGRAAKSEGISAGKIAALTSNAIEDSFPGWRSLAKLQDRARRAAALGGEGGGPETAAAMPDESACEMDLSIVLTRDQGKATNNLDFHDKPGMLFLMLAVPLRTDAPNLRLDNPVPQLPRDPFATSRNDFTPIDVAASMALLGDIRPTSTIWIPHIGRGTIARFIAARFNPKRIYVSHTDPEAFASLQRLIDADRRVPYDGSPQDTASTTEIVPVLVSRPSRRPKGVIPPVSAATAAGGGGGGANGTATGNEQVPGWQVPSIADRSVDLVIGDFAIETSIEHDSADTRAVKTLIAEIARVISRRGKVVMLTRMRTPVFQCVQHIKTKKKTKSTKPDSPVIWGVPRSPIMVLGCDRRQATLFELVVKSLNGARKALDKEKAEREKAAAAGDKRKRSGDEDGDDDGDNDGDGDDDGDDDGDGDNDGDDDGDGDCEDGDNDGDAAMEVDKTDGGKEENTNIATEANDEGPETKKARTEENAGETKKKK